MSSERGVGKKIGFAVGGILLTSLAAGATYLTLTKVMPPRPQVVTSVASTTSKVAPVSSYPLAAKIQFGNDTRFSAAPLDKSWVATSQEADVVKYTNTSSDAKLSLSVTTINAVQKTDLRQTEWIRDNTLYTMTKSFASDQVAKQVGDATTRLVPMTDGGVTVECAQVAYAYHKTDGDYMITHVLRQAGSRLILLSYSAKTSADYASSLEALLKNLKIEGKVTYVSAQQ